MNTLALLGGMGLPEMLIVLSILSLGLGLLVIWPAWRILTRVGLPPWMAILAVIPYVNVVLLFYVAFTEWPIDRELRASRRR